MDPHDALRHYFQFPEFRPGQEEALRQVLAGHDALVVMPTGSGKSLIYQLAALLLPHTTLVISPLVALMKDQVDGLSRRGIPATFINSSLDSSEQSERLRNLAAGRYKIVLVAPERLRLQNFRAAIARLPLSQFVIDEAHCLSQWGHDFRPDYLHVAEARRELQAPVTLALTATATQRVQDDILRLLGLPEAARFITGFNRPNLALEAFSTPDANAKLKLLRDFLPGRGPEPRPRHRGRLETARLPVAEAAGIIYVGTRRDAEEVADFVREVVGMEVDHYHAGLDADARTRVQDAFMSGDLPIVVATNAFGMGIDRPDVRFVLHYTMPGSLEAYYQEAGRAGRDGLPARAMLCYSPKDTALQEFFIDSDAPGREDLRALHNYLKGQGKAGAPARVSWESIEGALGMPQVKVRVALEQLELAGALRRLPAPNHRLVEVQTLPLSDARLNSMAAEASIRREHKHHLLELMVSYAETDACRRRTMLDYFGDHGDADAAICCDNCLARVEREIAASQPVQLAQTQAQRGALIVLDTIAHLKWGVGQSTLAQVLKGSGAQKMKGYIDARNYAKFAALRLKEIETLIGQLTTAGYIKQVGSTRPTLRLTPRGEDALKTHSAIEVELRPVRGGEQRRRLAERDAGSTVALSRQMLAQGLTPDQIAGERGLTARTIYSHLAASIAEGSLDVNAVVPATVQQQVRAAIAQAGSATYLSPIKALLPEEIDYGPIRCVVEAWKREQPAGA
jgi:ATP-dependent DNA helicase RecQ